MGGEDVKDDVKGNRVDVGEDEGDGGVDSNLFLMRGSTSRAGNTGRVTVGAEELKPRETGGFVGDPVATATLAVGKT